MTDLISEQDETRKDVASSSVAVPQKRSWLKVMSTSASVRAVWTWWQSPQGIAFSSLLGIAMILCALWLLNSVLVNSPKPETMQTTSQEADALPGQSDPVVAKVGTSLLHLSDIKDFAILAGWQIEEEPLSLEAAVANGLIDQAINQYLLAQAAQQAGLMRDPDIRERLAIASNRILASAYLDELATEATEDEKVAAFYNIQKEGLQFEEQVRLSAIYTRDIDTAVELHNALGEGGSFEEMAFEFSTDETSRRRQGDIGYFPRNLLPPEFADKLKGAKKGFVPLPFETDKGWTLVKISGSRQFTPPPLSATRDDIIAFLKSRAIATKLEQLREAVGVEVVVPTPVAERSLQPEMDDQTPVVPSPSPRPTSPTEPKTSGKRHADKPSNNTSPKD